jgi:hypothetical protein
MADQITMRNRSAVMRVTQAKVGRGHAGRFYAFHNAACATENHNNTLANFACLLFCHVDSFLLKMKMGRLLAP